MCEGMDIISYADEEVDSEREREISKILRKQKNPELMMTIKKLSDQYSNYKESYNFPSNFKSILSIIFSLAKATPQLQMSVCLESFIIQPLSCNLHHSTFTLHHFATFKLFKLF